jgi:hypothetical protein
MSYPNCFKSCCSSFTFDFNGEPVIRSGEFGSHFVSADEDGVEDGVEARDVALDAAILDSAELLPLKISKPGLPLGMPVT